VRRDAPPGGPALAAPRPGVHRGEPATGRPPAGGRPANPAPQPPRAGTARDALRGSRRRRPTLVGVPLARLRPDLSPSRRQQQSNNTGTPGLRLGMYATKHGKSRAKTSGASGNLLMTDRAGPGREPWADGVTEKLSCRPEMCQGGEGLKRIVGDASCVTHEPGAPNSVP